MSNFLNPINKPWDDLKLRIFGLSIMMCKIMGTEHFGKSMWHLELLTKRVSFVNLLWVILIEIFLNIFRSVLLISFQGFDFITNSFHMLNQPQRRIIINIHIAINKQQILRLCEITGKLFLITNSLLDFSYLLFQTIWVSIFGLDEL